jgi:hypothetical protein
MAVTYTFSTQSGSIPLAQLDANFATPITIGNTSVQLGNTITTLNNITLANTTISSGNVTLTNVSITTANVTTANITNAVIGTANVTTANVGTLTLTNALGTASGGTGLTSFTSGGVVYASSGSALSTGSALTFDGNANFSTGGSNPATYNTLNINNTSSTGYSRVLLNIGSAGANGVGSIKYAPGLFFAIGTDSDSSSTPMTFNLNNSEQMRLTSTGLGIGTSSPSYKLDVAGANPRIRVQPTTGTEYALYQAQNTGGSAFIGLENSTGSALSTGAGYSLNVYHSGAYPILFSTNATERMRLDSSGNLLVGTANPLVNPTAGVTITGASATWNIGINHPTGSASGNGYMSFVYNTTQIGSITQSGTTAVAYNTSSDYRLKNSISPMQNALEKVAALKPVTYKWNSDGSDGEGFIAHELAEVCPQAVTGEKDAVNDEGDPVYQGIDTSFLVATLTAALQEAHSLIKDLQTRVAQLEAK